MTNTTLLNNDFISNTLENGYFEWLRNFKSVRSSLITYYQPPAAYIGTFLNSVVFVLCILIYFKTKRKKHKPAFLFIGVLAFFDMAIGAMNAKGRKKEVETPLLRVTITLSFFTFVQWASFYTLLVLTIDRYIFIKRPLHYPLIMTPCRTWLLLLAAISVGMLVGVLSVLTVAVRSRINYFQLNIFVNLPIFSHHRTT
jgi:hypothetical protein